MKIKSISVGVAGIFLFIAAGLPQTVVAAEVKMDLRFAGAFVTGITHVVDPVTGATTISSSESPSTPPSTSRLCSPRFGPGVSSAPGSSERRTWRPPWSGKRSASEQMHRACQSHPTPAATLRNWPNGKELRDREAAGRPGRRKALRV